MPSVTRVAQAGSGRGAPSTSTTHIRQPPYGSSLSSWQSVGMNDAVARRRVDEQLALGALTGRPSSVNSTTALILRAALRAGRRAPASVRTRSASGTARPGRGRRSRSLHCVEPLLDLRPASPPRPFELLAEVVQRAVADPAGRALLARLLGEEAHRLGEQAQRRVARREHLEPRPTRRRRPTRARPSRVSGDVERGGGRIPLAAPPGTIAPISSAKPPA